jgi:ABC-type dipeptide/oligopeptide/nickel transport system permease subunit
MIQRRALLAIVSLVTLIGIVFPNSLAPIIVTTTLGVATAIIVEAALSFSASAPSLPPRAGAGI